MPNPLSHHDFSATISPEFGPALTREILRSERQRIVALLVTIAFFLAVTTAAYLALPEHVERLFQGQMTYWLPFAILAPLVVYEFGALRMIAWRLQAEQDMPAIARYASALVETSLPSIVLLVQIPMMGKAAALGFTAPMIYFLFVILSTLRLDFRLSAFTGLVAGTQLFAIGVWHGGLQSDPDDPVFSPLYEGSRSLLLAVGGVLAGAVGARLRRQFEGSYAAATARDRITDLFGQHVSPQVVERLLAAGADTPNDNRHVAVMFVDIRGFTAAARMRKPQEVVARLDDAFAVLVDIVDRNGGIVNKFLGDGFLALFGAPFPDPDAAARAATAAREMLDAMARANAASDWPLRLGIGLHVGEVVAGIVGSPRRKEYTVIGDTVNLASRIESLNKEFGTQLLISGAIHASLGDRAADAIPLGAVPIRGYDEAMAIWKVA